MPKNKKKRASRPGIALRNSFGSSSTGPPQPEYDKLLKRFYEPLILLDSLGRVRGNHYRATSDAGPTQVRRQFQDDLAFLCEYKKGGSACTAIGLEENPERFVFWVAANYNASKKIAPFLTRTLERLSTIMRSTGPERQANEEDLIETCLTYARVKVNGQRRFMKIHVRHVRKRLQAQDMAHEVELVDWLRMFEQLDDGPSLCRRAYETRNSDPMQRLRNLDLSCPSDRPMERPTVAKAVHYIGRLADHIRVPERVLQNLPQLERFLENSMSVSVQVVPKMPCVPQPEADHLTTCKGISNPTTLNVTNELYQALEEMDRKHSLSVKMEQRYSRKKKMRVHAEIQVLEYFHSHPQNKWVDDDRYIGCSKPACYCCGLYFQHHPAQPVRPSSHQTVYLAWGPPLLPGREHDNWYCHQRDILNKMLSDIREDAIRQIREREGPRTRHADSLTGFTSIQSDNASEDTFETEGGRSLRGDLATDSEPYDSLLDPLARIPGERSGTSVAGLDVILGENSPLLHRSEGDETVDDCDATNSSLARSICCVIL